MVLASRKRTDLQEGLRRARQLLGREVGIVKRGAEAEGGTDDFGVFNYVCEMNNYPHFLEGENRNGSTALFAEKAKMGAFGECVERYCCSSYDENDFIFESYERVKDYAVNVEDFVLYSESQYEREDFSAPRFPAEKKINWVEGYSLTEKREVLVPACFVYTPYRLTKTKEPLFLKETITTGAACGSSLEEAVIGGIYEVIERDAFAITWLNQLPLPRLDFASIRNESTITLVEKMKNSSLFLFANYITLDIKVPTFCAALMDTSGKLPILQLGCSSSLDPEKALLSSITELFQWRSGAKLQMKYYPGYTHKGDDFRDIDTMIKHGLLYGLTDMRDTFSFLVKAPFIKINDIPDKSSADVLEEINTCMKMFNREGMNVVVVDITTPDISEVGFFVVKVVISHMQPITGDYNYRRLGGRRLYEMPQKLAFSDKVVEEADLNRYPFPLI